MLPAGSIISHAVDSLEATARTLLKVYATELAIATGKNNGLLGTVGRMVKCRPRLTCDINFDN